MSFHGRDDLRNHDVASVRARRDFTDLPIAQVCFGRMERKRHPAGHALFRPRALELVVKKGIEPWPWEDLAKHETAFPQKNSLRR
jgi:hypothetical protein